MLELLRFCHRYIILHLQAHVTFLLKPLTETSTLRECLTGSDHGGLSTARILEVANDIDSHMMTNSARGLVIEETWKERKKPDTAPLLSDIHNILEFGERNADHEIVTCAYYQILLSKPQGVPWDTARLNARQIAILERGKEMLSKEWEDIFLDLGTREGKVTHAHNHRGLGQTVLHAFWARLAEAKFLPYDVVGRLQLLLVVWKDCGAWYGDGSNVHVIERWLLRVQTNIRDFFIFEENIPDNA